MADSREVELRRAFRCWSQWRHRRHLLVHVLAVLGGLFLFTALYPERASRDLLALYAALWSVLFVSTLGAAAQEWRWRRQARREGGAP